MRYPWLTRILLLLVGSLYGQLAIAQGGGNVPGRPSSALEVSRVGPIYLLDNKVIISNEYLVRAIDPRAIQDIHVYKNTSDIPARWRGLAANGLINITLKQPRPLKSWTFDQLGHRLRLERPVGYVLDGLPITNSGWHIARVAIGEIVLTRGTTGTLVELRTLQAPKTEYLPGTIMIRGTAAR